MVPEQRSTVGARVYVALVICAGLTAVGLSIITLLSEPVSYHWSLLAGLTLLSGSFTIRIPTISARLSVSETFVFAAVLLFGPAAATMIVVLDSLVISLWLGRRSQTVSRILFNMSAPATSIWLAAHIFYFLAAIQPLSYSPQPILPLLGPLVALAVVYFVLNSALIALAVGFDKGVSAYQVWRHNFLWLSLNYFSGASVAALLLPYLQPAQPQFFRVAGILLPLLLISYLTFKTAMGRVDDANRHLEKLNSLYLSTIETLAMAIDAKDQITHGHIRRVQGQAVRLAQAMGVREEVQIKAIEAAALLHDMGKLAVPEYILNKPGPLTPAEFEKMKLHASVGADILSAIEFPYPVVPIVRHHHENWDGTGYPDGLMGSSIPIGARILSVVDCYDALTSDRPYRPRLPDREALKIVSERRGTMYDPLVVDTFLAVHSEGLASTPSHSGGSSIGAARLIAAAGPTPEPANNSLEDISSSGEEMLSLFELARVLSSRLTVVDASEAILMHLRRMIPSSLSAVYLKDTQSTELVCVFALGDHAGLLTQRRMAVGQRLSGWVAANRRSIRNSDPVLDLGDSGRAMMPRLRSCLSSPVISEDGLTAVLTLYAEPALAYSEEHERLLETVARQVAPALMNAREHPDRNDLRSLDQPESAFLSDSCSFVVICARVRGLDQIGHDGAGGKQAAAQTHVAKAIRQQVRPQDVVFLATGDEFVVVQFGVSLSLATDTASRIQRGVEVSLKRTPLRVDTGLACAPADGDAVESLVDAARRRLSGTLVRRQNNDAVH